MSTIMIFTASKRSFGQGNVFTPVCHSVHRGGRGVCPTPSLPHRQTSWMQTSSGCRPSRYRPPDAHPPGCRPPPRQTSAWMQTPLDADPPGCRSLPLGRPPCMQTPLGRPPCMQTPLGRPPPRFNPPPRYISKRVVRILLECILVKNWKHFIRKNIYHCKILGCG